MPSDSTSLRSRLSRLWRRTATAATATAPATGSPSSSRWSTRDRRPADTTGASSRGAYAGDFTGTPDLAYAPKPDGRPDPGEIVWTWVPYEEDHRQGKDRPVLIIGRDREWLLALMLTSKDHDRDHEQEARHGRHWQDLGPGAWDSRGRPSEIRLDRILRVDATEIRREGAVLDRARFDAVATAVRAAR